VCSTSAATHRLSQTDMSRVTPETERMPLKEVEPPPRWTMLFSLGVSERWRFRRLRTLGNFEM
jgi:hypothetical protein